MSEANPSDTSVVQSDELATGGLLATIDRAQGLLTAFKQELSPHLEREADHLGEDLAVLEGWAEDAQEAGLDALRGAETVSQTALERAQYFEDQLGNADTGLRERLEQLTSSLEELDGEIRGLDIGAGAFVTYVNRSFAARYLDPAVRIGTILKDAGRDDVDELGLYPLNGLFGNAIPDLAFPGSQEVDLRKEHRTYWESESDGGLIA